MAFWEGLPVGAILNGSWVVVAFFATWYIGRMVYNGKLIPKAIHDELKEDRDNYRKAWEISEEARRLQALQIEEMLEGVKTLEQLIRSLPQPPRQTPRGGR